VDPGAAKKGEAMSELLKLLSGLMLFLVEPFGYRLVDSASGDSFGDAYVTVEGRFLFWQLVRDRSQVFFLFRTRFGADAEWYTADLLIELFEGRRIASAEVDTPMARWIETHLAEIEQRFAPDVVEDTLLEIRLLEERRAEEMFGSD
jgi:hypothetical protein